MRIPNPFVPSSPINIPKRGSPSIPTSLNTLLLAHIVIESIPLEIYAFLAVLHQCREESFTFIPHSICAFCSLLCTLIAVAMLGGLSVEFGARSCDPVDGDDFGGIALRHDDWFGG